MAKKQAVFVDERLLWNVIEESSHQAVVQIYASVSDFNWNEPYRLGEQKEVFGSGFFVNKEGLIATSAHVIVDAQVIFIRAPFFKRQLLEVEVLSICPELDVAMLVLSKKAKELLHKHGITKLPFLPLGDSYLVRRTQAVLVLGYPYGSMTLKGTTGIVSGREQFRDITLLQTTAPINEGNSGCPILDHQGNVIGIASAVMKYAQNVAYGIPIQVFIDIFSDLKKQKKLLQKTNNWGLVPVVSADEKAAWLKNPEPGGLYIATVYNGTVSEKLGLQQGDMLYEMAGNPVNEYGEISVSWSYEPVILADFLLHTKVGEIITGVVYRNGKKVVFKGKIPFCNPFAIQFKFPQYESVLYETIGGIVLMELSLNHVVLFREDKAEMTPFLFPESWYKPTLVISHVIPGSLFQQTRCIFPGDILSEVNGIRVSTLSDFRQAFVASQKTGFLALKTNQNVLTVQPYAAILEQEQQLRTRNAIPASSTTQK